MKNIWTEEETKILKANYLKYDQRELHKKFLPWKSAVQIRNKKMYMGWKKPPVWTNEERGTLLEHGANYTTGQLKKKFFPNKTTDQISGMRKHFSICRRK
tara:strand:- start:192 stop:491 length:300 start_codon:yes stop_codon:yes gene_type:complete